MILFWTVRKWIFGKSSWSNTSKGAKSNIADLNYQIFILSIEECIVIIAYKYFEIFVS